MLRPRNACAPASGAIDDGARQGGQGTLALQPQNGAGLPAQGELPVVPAVRLAGVWAGKFLDAWCTRTMARVRSLRFSLPVSRMEQLWVTRPSSAVVIFVSARTLDFAPDVRSRASFSNVLCNGCICHSSKRSFRVGSGWLRQGGRSIAPTKLGPRQRQDDSKPGFRYGPNQSTSS